MSNKFLDAQESIQELKEQQQGITIKMGNAVAMAIVGLARDGKGNAKSVSNDIGKLLSGLSDKEKVDVLLAAIGKVVVNM